MRKRLKTTHLVPSRCLWYIVYLTLIYHVSTASSAPPVQIEKVESRDAEEEQDDEGETGTKILSKKEKEKLKKEREKASPYTDPGEYMVC